MIIDGIGDINNENESVGVQTMHPQTVGTSFCEVENESERNGNGLLVDGMVGFEREVPPKPLPKQSRLTMRGFESDLNDKKRGAPPKSLSQRSQCLKGS